MWFLGLVGKVILIRGATKNNYMLNLSPLDLFQGQKFLEWSRHASSAVEDLLRRWTLALTTKIFHSRIKSSYEAFEEISVARQSENYWR